MFDNFLTDVTGIGIILTFVLGWAFKKWPAFQNRFIPIATACVAILTQVINSVPPVEAAVAAAEPGYAQAGIALGGLLNTLASAALQWLLTDAFYDRVASAKEGIVEGEPPKATTSKKKG